MMAGNGGAEFVERKEGNQIIHVRGDSDSLMNSLFDSVLKKQESTMPLQVPLHMRKLPKSFFNPPSYGSKSPSVSHSRTSSTDSTQGGLCALTSAGGGGAPLCAASPLQSTHMRAHSSPATLQQTYAAAAAAAAAAQQQHHHQHHQQQQQHHHHQQQQQQSHLKQHSFDFVGDGRSLPPGWEQARTSQGQTYFINHVDKTTTWEDPRKSGHALYHAAIGSPSSQSHSPAPPAASVVSSQQLQQQLQQLSVTGGQALGPLPDGWAQAETEDGEIYFINHTNRTTSWFDPRIPERLQRPPALHGSSNSLLPAAAPAAGAGGGGGGGVNSSPQQLQQQQQQQQHQSLRVQQLKLESERLRFCKRQVMKQWVNSDLPQLDQQQQQQQQQQSRASADDEAAAAAAAARRHQLQQQQQQQLLRPAAAAGLGAVGKTAAAAAALESFLTAGGLSADFHARQESADSGVGMNGAYSLPHTPDNLLSPMDDNMDHTDNGAMVGMTGAGAGGGGGGGGGAGGGAAAAAGGDNTACATPVLMETPDLPSLDNMDSDDLVPSIQQLDNGSIAEDMLLNDVTSIINANRINEHNPTWL